MSEEKTKTVKYRNDTGGLIFIPRLAKNSHLVGAIAEMEKVEDGKTFSCECNDDGPINPSLRVASKAAEGGITPASEPSRKSSRSRMTREI